MNQNESGLVMNLFGLFGRLGTSFRYNGFWDREEKCDVSKIQICEIMDWLAYSERTT